MSLIINDVVNIKRVTVKSIDESKWFKGMSIKVTILLFQEKL